MDLYGLDFTKIVSMSIHSTSAPNSFIIHIVRSIYGREKMLPVSLSSKSLLSVGAIISKADIYWELTLPGISS